jgi:hypothetical protein
MTQKKQPPLLFEVLLLSLSIHTTSNMPTWQIPISAASKLHHVLYEW